MQIDSMSKMLEETREQPQALAGTLEECLAALHWPAQLLAARLAAIRGLNPDRPRLLQKITRTM